MSALPRHVAAMKSELLDSFDEGIAAVSWLHRRMVEVYAAIDSEAEPEYIERTLQALAESFADLSKAGDSLNSVAQVIEAMQQAREATRQ